jgi:hypothetical protein
MGDAVYAPISHLAPRDDAQRALKTEAATLMVQLAEIRALLQAQAVPSVSKPLLIALMIWLVAIFLGFSLLAPANATSTVALMAGAFSVACAIFIILELDFPFAGIVRVPSEPMIKTLAPPRQRHELNPRPHQLLILVDPTTQSPPGFQVVVAQKTNPL